MYQAAAVLVTVLLAVNARSVLDTRSGYTLYPGIGYYKFHDELLNWSDAHKVCLREGGHLAIFNSQEEAQLLWYSFKSKFDQYSPYCHLGFHDLYLKNNFTTIYGEPLERTGYDNWPHFCCIGPGKCAGNSTSNNTGCGAMGTYSCQIGYFVRSCNERYNFFCEKELWHEYELVANQGYYKLHLKGKTWGDAWKTCQHEGAQLAVIESSSEASSLQTILRRHLDILESDSNDRVHLGFHNKLSPDIYNTVHGMFLNSTGYFQWSSKQPSTDGNCGGLMRNEALFMGSCDAKLAFFCKHPVIKK